MLELKYLGVSPNHVILLNCLDIIEIVDSLQCLISKRKAIMTRYSKGCLYIHIDYCLCYIAMFEISNN